MLARQGTQSSRMFSSKLATSSGLICAARPQPLRQTRWHHRQHAIEEKRDTAGSEASSSPDTLSQEQLAKLAELRRLRADAAPQMNSNIVAGAIEEAQLISWPTPGKALMDTVLVLAIVSVTGFMLFSLNVVLADASNWWYSR